MPWTHPEGGGLLWGGDWEYEWLRATLQLMTDTFAELSGFELVSLNVVEGDQLVSTVNTDVAAPGTIQGEAISADQLIGMRFPLQEVLNDLKKADDWGYFKYIPKERMEGYQGSAWISSRTYGDEPDAWHALATLWAPLHNDAGEMVGLVAVDQPADGKIPNEQKRVLLNRLAAQVENALLNALANAQLRERATLAGATHEIVRSAAGEQTVAGIVAAATNPVIAAFSLTGAVFRLFPPQNDLPAVIRAGAATDLPQDALPTVMAHKVAPLLLEQGAVGIIGQTQTVNVPDGVPVEDIRTYLRVHGFGSMMFIPLGTGPRCIGALTLLRDAEAPEWSRAEYQACLDLGLDLGTVLAATAALEQEQQVVHELTELDAYKDGLVAKVSDELRAPLRSLVGGLERLAVPDGRDAATVASMQQDALRLNLIVDNLLQLARVADPTHPVDQRPVDLVPVVEQVCELAASLATLGQELTVSVPREPVVVAGSATELRRMVENLVSNAVRFMPYPGSIKVTLVRSGQDATLSVSDDGIGIKTTDLGRIFEEFYRSDHPVGRELQGTGLGLAIVSRVVYRHGGHIEVTSATNQGSTFRVFLPLAAGMSLT